MVSREITQMDLGFSFGLRPDSSPGPVNEHIAKTMQVPRSAHVFVGVQWEIAILLDRLPERWDAVAATPLISAKDIRHSDKILRRLATPESPADKQIAERIGPSVATVDDLVDRLNTIIDDPLLYVHFGDVTVSDLSRPKRNRTWTEFRALPKGTAALHPLQARRINRFILESVFADELTPHTYLNTTAVADILFQKLHELPATTKCVGTIRIFCHPLHITWCGFQIAKTVDVATTKWPGLCSEPLKDAAQRVQRTFDSLSKTGAVPFEKLGLADTAGAIFWGPLTQGISVDPADPHWWDAESSQEWTRNRRDYDIYVTS